MSDFYSPLIGGTQASKPAILKAMMQVGRESDNFAV